MRRRALHSTHVCLTTTLPRPARTESSEWNTRTRIRRKHQQLRNRAAAVPAHAVLLRPLLRSERILVARWLQLSVACVLLERRRFRSVQTDSSSCLTRLRTVLQLATQKLHDSTLAVHPTTLPSTASARRTHLPRSFRRGRVGLKLRLPHSLLNTRPSQHASKSAQCGQTRVQLVLDAARCSSCCRQRV